MSCSSDGVLILLILLALVLLSNNAWQGGGRRNRRGRNQAQQQQQAQPAPEPTEKNIGKFCCTRVHVSNHLLAVINAFGPLASFRFSLGVGCAL